MHTVDWVQADIDALHEMVMEALADGKTREEAFKQFARIKGIKSVNAIRYKWVTTSPSPAELTGEVELLPSEFRSRNKRAAKLNDATATAERADAGPMGSQDLREELLRVKSMIGKLRDKNTRLRRENRQLTNNLQALLAKPTSDKPQVVVLVGAEGWNPENLAKFIQCTQTETEWSEFADVRNGELRA